MALNTSVLTAVKPTSKPEITTLLDDDTLIVFRGDAANLQMYRFTKQSLSAFITAVGGGGSSITLVDNVTSTSTTEALTANQGKILKDLIDTINSNLGDKLDVTAYNPKFKGRFSTFTALETNTWSEPLEAGDYAVVDDENTVGDTLVYLWDLDPINPDGGYWTQSGSIGPNTTDDLAEGNDNLYFTDSNLIVAFNNSVVVTDDLAEGSTNLYFTEQRVYETFKRVYISSVNGTTGNTTILANGNLTGDLTFANMYYVLKVITSYPARIRLYTDSTARDNDINRPIGTDPTGNHGLLLEFVSSAGNLSKLLTPAVLGYNKNKTSTDTVISYTVTNLDTVTRSSVFSMEVVKLNEIVQV